MQNKKPTLTVFLDAVGRTIIGKTVKETETTLSVENPALVHVQPNPQTNQLSLQIFPLFFKEFQSNRSEPTVWNYNKSQITTSEAINFAEPFVAQYTQLFEILQQASSQQKEAEVVKLFEE